MSSWSTILGFGLPVVGQPDDYGAAAQQSADLCEASQQVTAAFAQVRKCGSDDLRGQAADGLRELVANVDKSLKDLPIVLGDVTRILENHERDLEQLKGSVKEAMARAKTRWDTLQNTERKVDRERGELSSLRSQRNRTPRIPENEEHIARLNSLISSQIAQVQQHEAQRDEAKATICRNMTLGRHPGNCSGVPDGDAVGTNSTSCYEYMSLHNQEQVLVRRTVQGFGDLDLRELRDPNWLENMSRWVLDRVSDFGDWFADFLSDIGKMVGAFLDGEWGKALHYLRDVLDKVIVILTVAALAVGVFVTAGALGVVLAVAAGSHLLVSLFLAAMGEPHPETGQPVTWLEAAFDGAVYAMGGALAKSGARMVAKGVNKVFRKQYFRVGKRQSVKEWVKQDWEPWKMPKHSLKKAFSSDFPGIPTKGRQLKFDLWGPEQRLQSRMDYGVQLAEPLLSEGVQLAEPLLSESVKLLSESVKHMLFGQQEHVNNYRVHGPSLMSGNAVPLVCAK